MFRRTSRLGSLVLLTSTLAAGLQGCTSSTAFNMGHAIPAIPAHRVPRDLLARPREEMVEISIARLRQSPPEVYRLAAGDILGIYIDYVLGDEETAPPVHYPEDGSQPPALGFPVPVREDGTLALPLVDPINVDGMTLEQATEAIKYAYTIERQIVAPDEGKFIVTLMRRRQFRVLVVREEHGNAPLTGNQRNANQRGAQGNTSGGRGFTIDLPAYENDLLHALNETGGLPGLDAENQVYIIRGNFADGAAYDAFAAQILACREPCSCPPPPPEDPNVTVIPIRFYPDQVPQFTEEDIILNTGDIVYIKSRDQEKFYAGGVLPGGEYLLPRDYDLNALAAIAVAGGQLGSGGTGLGSAGNRFGGGQGGASGCAPSDLIVIRQLPCGGTIPIRVDVNRALLDEQQNILIMPEDTLILRYKLREELYNATLNLLQFNFLFSGFSGQGI